MNALNIRLKENPLRDIKDLRQSLYDLLSTLKNYSTGSGYNLGSTAAHYPAKIAWIEGWSRTLWGIGPLIAGGREYKDIDICLSILKNGIDPNSPHFWGTIKERDQRMVEMASIALCLIIAKDVFWDPLSKQEKQHLYTWLSAIQDYELPPTNWHFFRIFVCLAFRELGLDVNEQAEKESFDIIESCYQNDGWYSDGVNGAYDLYNPMGFHFYGLVYAKIAGKNSAGSDVSKRAADYIERYIERAKLFAPRFASWFNDDGSIIPYGRSLTYRFASLSFFSACAYAGVEVLPWGMMKRIVLQGLRWWFSKPILDNGGILSCGYSYPNLVMADHYNSPGSPYWSFKTFLVLALSEDHPFWQAEEVPLSRQNIRLAASTVNPAVSSAVHAASSVNPKALSAVNEDFLSDIFVDKVPGFIISRNAEDVQLLCSGGMPHFEMNHASQKYSKFAYSSRFGFCVSHSPWSLEQAGGDSMLLLSDAGEEHWRERRTVTEKRSGQDWISSIWQPWHDVKVSTILCYTGSLHLRIHRIESGRVLKTAEGAFALSRYHKFDDALPIINSASKSTEALVSFPWGASRIAALEPSSERTGIIIIPAPNLNILEPNCVIPTLTGNIGKGITVLATAVCAGDSDVITGRALPEILLHDDCLEIFEGSGVRVISSHFMQTVD